MAPNPDNLHEWMHPAFFKALNEIATPRRTAWQIWETTTDKDVREMLDLVAIYVGTGEFEKSPTGKYDFGKSYYFLDHFYRD